MSGSSWEIEITPTSAQQDFINAGLSGRYTVLGYGGAIGGAKTWAVIIILRLLCRAYPGSRWAIMRKDLPTLRRNTIPSLKALGLPEPRHDDWTINLPNGSQIILIAESLDTDPDMNRLKGLEVNGFVLEQAEEISEKTYQACIQRAGRWFIRNGKQPPPLILATFNPAPGWVKHTFHDPWVKGALAPPYYFRQALPSDNPHLSAQYLENLKVMSEWEYNRFVKGQWDQLTGAALAELDRKRHILKPFPVPGNWQHLGAFDWGFRHLWVFGDGAVNEDGRLFVVDTVRGRGHQPPEIVERIRAKVPLDRVGITYAGHDLWNVERARQDYGPTLAEEFGNLGLVCAKANIARIQGLSTLRRLLAWRRKGPPTKAHPEGSPGDPDLVFMDTPGNQWLFEQLQSMVLDPTSGEDVLKVDADEHGRGGDDGYDMIRYLAASRVAPAPEQIADLNLNDPMVRAIEATAQKKVLRVPGRQVPGGGGYDDPELGGYV